MPGDPFQQWAAQQGWRIARDVPTDVLEQLPGPPFHEYRRKAISLLLAGLHEGMPALVMQLANSYQHSAPSGSYYSPGADRQVSTSTTHTGTSMTSVAVLELPAPVPELLVEQQRDKLDDVLNLFRFNRSRRPFQTSPVATVQIGDPSRSLEAFTYHLSGASPQYVQAVATPERLNWLYASFGTYAGLDVQARPYFRFSGRKVICWTGERLFNPKAVDDLLGWAHFLTSWIPPAAFQDPAAAQADQQHTPLPQLQLPFS